MRPQKPKLKLGKRCKKTVRKKKQSQLYTATLSLIQSEKEIFRKISFRSSSSKIYTPRKLSTKTFQSSPLNQTTPKRKIVIKRMSTSTRSKTAKTPSKSPSAKKVRRSLYSPKSGIEQTHFVEKSSVLSELEMIELESLAENASALTEPDVIEPGNLVDNTEVVTDQDVNQSSNTVLHAEIEELTKLIPSVMENLSDEGYDKEMLNFFRMVNESNFPLNNISFQLWMEVVKWFSCENTTEMRYSEETKKFWKLGYRIFGGQFLYFMSGFKSRNTVVQQETEKGLYPPRQSEINFAVPGQDILRRFSPYNTDINTENSLGRRPGLLFDMIGTLSSASKTNSYCLTFDGKKIKRGLTKSSGDVDLLGFENDATLKDKTEQTENLKRPVEDLIRDFCGREESQDISLDVPQNEINDIVETLLFQQKNVSLNILNARQLRKKKEYAKAKLIERSGGSDWKNGKYVLGISAHIAFIHDIDEYLKESVALLDEITKCICCLKHSNKVIDKEEMNIKQCCDYKAIEPPCHQTSRHVKQRTKEWFDHRAKSMVTGSTMYAALGLDGLSKQKEHFDVKIGGLPDKPKPEQVMSAMKHGTDNEINAVATMVGKVLPMLCPGQSMYEEGFIRIGSKDQSSFMVVSPDGSIRSEDGEEFTTVAVELKCPVFDVQIRFPERYLLQCLSEIEALNVESLLYLCWRPDISTVFKVNRNMPLFQKAFKLAEIMYNTDKPKRPTKLSDESKSLKEEIVKTCKSEATVEFVGVFPSLKHNSNSDNSYDNGRFLIRRLEVMLNQLVTNHDKFHDLQRQPATEAIVFLCCDLDRKWGKNTAQSVPVCWFPKGNSLDTMTLRKIFEWVLDECKKAEIHAPAASFDGQWHNIAVRDVNDTPLTLLQLQRDVWKKVEKMTKREQLKAIAQLNKTVQVITCQSITSDSKTLVCSNGGLVVPTVSKSIARDRLKRKHKSENTDVNGPVSDIRDDQNEEFAEDVTDEFLDAYIGNPDNEQSHNSNIDVGTNLQEQNATRYVGSATTVMDESDLNNILTQLKLDKHCNAKKQWENKGHQDLLEYFESGQTLRKLRDVELRIVVRYINRTRKIKIKESDRKEAKVQNLCKLLNVENSSCDVRMSRPPSKIRQPKSLSEQAFKKVSSTLKKSDLNIIYSEYVWETELRQWDETRKRLGSNIIEGVQFYYPSYSETRHQFEVCCIDSSHLLTRMRRKSAKGGLDKLGNEAWRKVAKSKKTALSLGMVDCILEPMTVTVANTHFSEAVEKEMRENGDTKEADLCKDIRQWWRAEDEPGIPAGQRIFLRSALRERLMDKMDFSKFPPPGKYIDGWPTQLWEGTIASIDAKQILYNLTPNHTYNVRAFSSMMGETFFSELTLYDRRGQGCVTCQEFGQYIDTSVEKLHMRMDPKRSLSYATSRKKVYNLVEQCTSSEITKITLDDADLPVGASSITIRDHEFDHPARIRVKAKNKEAKMETGRNAIARGALGVRWEHARRNESKVLPTYRLGIDIKDL